MMMTVMMKSVSARSSLAHQRNWVYPADTTTLVYIGKKIKLLFFFSSLN